MGAKIGRSQPTHCGSQTRRPAPQLGSSSRGIITAGRLTSRVASLRMGGQVTQ